MTRGFRLRVDQIAKALRQGRLALGETQQELAGRVGVSARLWAEVERGERPNVSLETALRLLAAVGIRVQLKGLTSAPRDGDERDADERDADERDAALARAAHRRATWTGGRVPLGAAHEPRVDNLTTSERMGAVAQISQLAYAVANGADSGASAERAPRTAIKRHRRTP